jgi:hypothetical protein
MKRMFGVQEKITEKEENDLCRHSGQEGGLPALFKLLWDLNQSAAHIYCGWGPQ